MGQAEAQYIIGIDLGTTNCTMSYTKIPEGSAETPDITVVDVAQVTAAGVQSERASLPSFVYFPLDEELHSAVAGVEWDEGRGHCVGVFARERGGELPDRMVSSAKSWLCHAGIDRREKVLPASGDGMMSPVEACGEFLRHLREVWDHKMGDAPFAEQTVLVTVPASFDPSARQLVEEAAEQAGYPKIIPLEEPQAAFYAWLHRNSDSWRDKLAVGDSVLVVDVGGGTTDFTLIKVVDDSGDLGLERVAVGDHLLLGGDNMDLALAYHVKGKLEEQGHDIDDWQLQGLVGACRQAKEQLLSEEGPETVDVTIHGRGSGLVGGALTMQVSRDEASALLVDGFIPLVTAQERSLRERRSGIQQVGLPYAQDPRISSQLARFLSMTGESDGDTMDRFVVPTAVLFNGGTLKGSKLRDRLIEVLSKWGEELGQGAVQVLDDADYDYAVSRGAAYYGVAREGGAVRIKGGTSRSYYLGVEGAAPAVPGVPTPMTAVCVVPFSMEEGTEDNLPDQEFALVLGELATFRFFSRAVPTLSDGTEPVMGAVVRQWKKELTELHAVEMLLEKGDDDARVVRVSLRSKVTELGVLELWCVANDGREWKLEFDIRASDV